MRANGWINSQFTVCKISLNPPTYPPFLLILLWFWKQITHIPYFTQSKFSLTEASPKSHRRVTLRCRRYQCTLLCDAGASSNARCANLHKLHKLKPISSSYAITWAVVRFMSPRTVWLPLLVYDRDNQMLFCSAPRWDKRLGQCSSNVWFDTRFPRWALSR